MHNLIEGAMFEAAKISLQLWFLVIIVCILKHSEILLKYTQLAYIHCQSNV